MPQFDLGLVQIIKNVFEEVMARAPSRRLTIEVKVYLAGFILRTAARIQTSYDRLLAVTGGAVANCGNSKQQSRLQVIVKSPIRLSRPIAPHHLNEEAVN